LTDLYLINQKIVLESGGEEIYLEEKMIENYINKVINGDCIKVMGEMPEGSVDLIVTSPPYGVNIAYDTHDDDMEINQYLEFSKNWLTEAYKVLKDDGRIALNIPYEINRQEKGGRIFLVSEVYQVMKQIGFKFFGIVDLEEDSPHRSKTTAWGSWMSPSSPYIYNPKECVILAYKKHHIKKVKGEPQWKGVPTQIEQEDGTFKTKVVYQEEDKREFMELVFGQWKYLNDSRPMTKATFSMDIPTKAIKILSYKNDIVLDPFNGSGTSCVAAETLDRRWIGIELSPNYTEIARQRIQAFVDQKKQQEIEFENGGL
jgi:site-specific DNA-methyltransferase (adenine-specific)